MNSVLVLGEQILAMIDTSIYVVMGRVYGDQTVSDYHSSWLNIRHARETNRLSTSNSPANAARKFYELLLGNPDLSEEPRTTPVVFDEPKLVSCQMGGGVRWKDSIVSCSSEAPEHDLLIAATLIYAMKHQVGAYGSMCSLDERVGGMLGRAFTVSSNAHFLPFVAQVCRTSIVPLPDGDFGVFAKTTDVRGIGPMLGVIVGER